AASPEEMAELVQGDRVGHLALHRRNTDTRLPLAGRPAPKSDAVSRPRLPLDPVLATKLINVRVEFGSSWTITHYPRHPSSEAGGRQVAGALGPVVRPRLPLARPTSDSIAVSGSHSWPPASSSSFSLPARREAAEGEPGSVVAGSSVSSSAAAKEACWVRKSIRHAARAYSWISPRSRSRRWSWSGGFEPTRRRRGPGIGGASPRARCGLCSGRRRRVDMVKLPAAADQEPVEAVAA